MAKKAQYLIPNAEGTAYEEVHLETSADQVLEKGTAKRFVTISQKDFLDKNQENIILKKDISKNFESSSSERPASAKDVKELKNAVGDIVFIVSPTKPSPQAGKTIVWIEG